MKKAIVASLLATGLLLAAKPDKMSTHTKLSANQRVALETQSPRVHVRKHATKHSRDRVVADKHTINAYVSSGK